MINETIAVILLFTLSFILTFFLTRWWINISKHHKSMLVPDMQKYKKPLIPKVGGVAVVISIVVNIFIFIFIKTFILNSSLHLTEILTIILIVLLACFIGFIDDIFGWEKSSISGYKKILMTVFIAVPLMIINAGHSMIILPLLGEVNLGLVYPLIVVPLAIVGTTNGYNLLAGYNGLESSLGIVIFSTLGLIALFTDQIWLVVVAGIIVFSLIAFLIFNKVPAKVFPGNTLTYILGALIGCFAIIGNMERSALVLFIPFIIEGFLKLRSKFKAWNFGIPNKDNSLEMPYKKIFSLTHLSIWILKRTKPSKKVYERDVVILLSVLEIILMIITIILFLFSQI